MPKSRTLIQFLSKFLNYKGYIIFCQLVKSLSCAARVDSANFEVMCGCKSMLQSEENVKIKVIYMKKCKNLLEDNNNLQVKCN